MGAELRGQARSLASLIHQIRMTIHGWRGATVTSEDASVVCDALDQVRRHLASIVEQAERELTAGASELEDALRVLKAIGAERRLQAREPEPAAFEGVYVPEPDKPEYLRDMARPTNVVILASVRRSRPEGGAR